MLKYRSLLLLIIFLRWGNAFAQADVNTETFKFNFITTSQGGRVLYQGKNHTFSFDLKGKKVTAQVVKGSAENLNFMMCDNFIVQSSWVPIPQPIPKNIILTKLDVNHQKEILGGYVDYELDYFKSLNIKMINLKKEWVTINSKLFTLWYFENDNSKVKDVSTATVAQIFLATTCFNQVWILNIPLTDKKEKSKSIEKVEEIANTLKLYNTRLVVK